jgi:hypothetical protein
MNGIFHEISYAAIIRDNRCARNGFAIPAQLRGGAITVTSSPDVQIYGNRLTDNHAGITINQDDRGAGAYGPYQVKNLDVHDNLVVQTDGGRAAGLGGNDPTFDQFSSSANNKFAHNSYVLGRDARFQWGSTALTWPQWQSAGQDRDGSVQLR